LLRRADTFALRSAPVDAARRSSYLNLLRVAPGGRRRTTTDAAHRPPNGTPQEQL